jgi:ATP-dependent DNA ligase
MQKIDVCDGLSLPFFPMRPTTGRTLRTPKLVHDFLASFDSDYWVMHPKLNGDRVSLAVVEGRCWAQNRHGGWYRNRVKNADAFLRLGDGFCLDGEVFESVFYPFDTVAERGQLCAAWPTDERERLTKKLLASIKQPWVFDAPSPEWIEARQANMPKWEGLVLKCRKAGYVRHGDDQASSLAWMRRRWDNRKLV